MYRSKATETVFVQKNHEQNCSKFKSINKQEFVIKKSCNVSPVSASFTVTLSKLFIVEVSDILFNSLLVITAEFHLSPCDEFSTWKCRSLLNYFVD